jgi:hypothetical protein
MYIRGLSKGLPCSYFRLKLICKMNSPNQILVASSGYSLANSVGRAYGCSKRTYCMEQSTVPRISFACELRVSNAWFDRASCRLPVDLPTLLRQRAVLRGAVAPLRAAARGARRTRSAAERTRIGSARMNTTATVAVGVVMTADRPRAAKRWVQIHRSSPM